MRWNRAERGQTVDGPYCRAWLSLLGTLCLSTVLASRPVLAQSCGNVQLQLTPDYSFAVGASSGGSTYTWTLNGQEVGQGAITQLALFHFDNALQSTSGVAPGKATGVSFVSGKFGAALSLAPNGVLTYPAAGNISVTDGTIEMWVGMSADGSAPVYSQYSTLFLYTASNGDQIVISASNGHGFYGGTNTGGGKTATGTRDGRFSGDQRHGVARGRLASPGTHLLFHTGRLTMYIDGENSGHARHHSDASSRWSVLCHWQ